VRRYEKKVYYTVFHMTGSKEEARDITQETFLRVLRGLKGLKNPQGFSKWLLRIATNLVRDHFRTLHQTWEEDCWEEVGGDDGEDPFNRFVAVQARERLLEAITHLPPRQRMAVVLRIYNDLAFKEVAEIMGCQVSTARSLFWTGVREIRKKVEREI